MFREILFLLLFCAVVQRSQAVVDLTPRPTEYTAEGVTVTQLVFTDNERSITYEPPRGWSWRHDAGRLILAPPRAAFATAAIQATPLATPQPIDATVAATLKQQFVASLPPASQMVEVNAEEQNPIPVNGTQSYAVTASYFNLGETYLRCTVFMRSPDTQLQFQVTARKADFDAVNTSFRRSILGFRWN